MPDTHRLLGVRVPDRYRAVVSEIFELFKTSWEPAADDCEYEVIVCHSECATREGRSLTIVTGGPGAIDAAWDVPSAPPLPPRRTEVAGVVVDLLHPWFPVGPRGEAFVWRGARRIRLGYDLFEEIEALLTRGQAGEAAIHATAARHLEVLKVAMLEAGVPIVEVEPVPAGSSLAVALTHDVDFARMRNHFFDRTAAGFLARATVGTAADVLRGRAGLGKLGRNLAAAAKLPLVYMGLAEDPWNCFDRYAALEREWRSTFYVVPRRDHAGRSAPGGDNDPARACRYQASEIAADLRALRRNGFEVGLHGIDAWIAPEDAAAERSEIERAVGDRPGGVRMHWLYRGEDTYAALESAGFDHDSSFGFNDAVGFRAGTGQVFRPLGARRLLELPLVVQDTALFAARRLRLDEREAFSLCEQVIAEAIDYGKGLTLLWHLRSIGPERWWGDFYRRLLDRLKRAGAWLAPAGEIVELHRRRREIDLDVRLDGGRLALQARGAGGIDRRLQLRVRFPDSRSDLRLPLHEAPFELRGGREALGA